MEMEEGKETSPAETGTNVGVHGTVIDCALLN